MRPNRLLELAAASLLAKQVIDLQAELASNVIIQGMNIYLVKTESLCFRHEEPEEDAKRNTKTGENRSHFSTQVPGVGIDHVRRNKSNNPAATRPYISVR